MAANLKEDPTFYDRADSHIHLANEHCADIGHGKVSASMLYGCARFQAFNAACWTQSAEEMEAKRRETVTYFVEQYRTMLEDNFDDYIKNFEKYVGGA
ncbi:DUF3144 domain-containing protein [Niveibacterium sp.]|uniref:DUF3144 domain-containing protein n=1 Tax=Niveibacterium sp. TaxID=2017444 RepID=UPI0035B0CD33